MKQTEVGLIPDDWKTVAIGDVAAIVGGGTPSTLVSGYWNGEIQWFTPAELNGSKKYVSKSLRTITKAGLQGSSARLLPKGTVLLTTRASIGITAILKNEACTNQGFQSLIAKENCYNEFLYYVIPLIKKEMMARASGSTFAEISAKKLSTITFQLPPLAEQHRIAKALSDVDAVISTTEKLIQKKKDIKQGAMQNLLTGKKRLPGFAAASKLKQTELGEIPEDWEVKKIKDFAKVQAGGTPSTLCEEYWNGSILWMNSGELNLKRVYNVEGRITELGLNNSSTHLIPKGCVLIGLAGQGKTRGTAAINYVELCTNQSIAAIFPSTEHDSEFLYQNMDNRYYELRELSDAGGGRGGLNLKIINSLEIALPSKSEQTAIANVLSSMDKEIETLNTKLEKYRNLKTAIMQQLLTGKIRLRQEELFSE